MGQRYQVHIVNPTSERIEAVVSVDGLDAIDGKPANPSKRGYLVPAYGDVTIDGFRTSLDAVAAFRFSSVRDSYGARTGHARNVGVVGVAFFAERLQPPPPPVAVAPEPLPSPSPYPVPAATNADSEARRAAPPAAPKVSSEGAASGAAAPATRPGLGTQFGEQRESHVVETAFNRASSRPMLVSELRYDDREGLVSRGIQLPQPWRDPRAAENDLRDTAQAFPQSRFAQPPPSR
jgi:hypothetical protein